MWALLGPIALNPRGPHSVAAFVDGRLDVKGFERAPLSFSVMISSRYTQSGSLRSPHQAYRTR
uniref:Uncharacterized protein n=1 Tax=Salix viminalis TaxID=40686 RepID=A0A6N2N0K9_SALVM